jgi:outer membrane protein assembly factor BamB
VADAVRGVPGGLAASTSVGLLMGAVLLVTTACGGNDAVWSVEAPDAAWVAGDETTIVTVSPNEVVAWASADGSERWRAELAAAWPAAVTVGDAVVAVATDRDGRSQICGLDLDTGDERWCEPVADRAHSTAADRQPAVATTGDLVVVATQEGVLLGLDAREGGVRWEETFATGRAPVTRAHLAVADDLLVALHPETGRVVGLGPASGDVVFEHAVEPFLGPYGLTIRDGLVLVHDAGSVHALDTTGETRWETGELPSPGPSHQSAAAHPVVVGDRVVVAPQAASTPGREGFTLTAVRRGDGEVEWVLEEPPAFTREPLESTGSLLEVGGTLVVAGEDLHVLDGEDGAVTRTLELGRERASGEVVVDGDVVVLDGQGRLRRMTP